MLDNVGDGAAVERFEDLSEEDSIQFGEVYIVAFVVFSDDKGDFISWEGFWVETKTKVRQVVETWVMFELLEDGEEEATVIFGLDASFDVHSGDAGEDPKDIAVMSSCSYDLTELTVLHSSNFDGTIR
ncbi:hypothetical protein AA313_de0207510 [Arthrobotrys entomopaga]|nr:hypothetical protein AA313_de0207510 [Arthrobotrys entomopaga]